jgi:hypothetical protein
MMAAWGQAGDVWQRQAAKDDWAGVMGRPRGQAGLDGMAAECARSRSSCSRSPAEASASFSRMAEELHAAVVDSVSVGKVGQGTHLRGYSWGSLRHGMHSRNSRKPGGALESAETASAAAATACSITAMEK